MRIQIANSKHFLDDQRVNSFDFTVVYAAHSRLNNGPLMLTYGLRSSFNQHPAERSSKSESITTRNTLLWETLPSGLWGALKLDFEVNETTRKIELLRKMQKKAIFYSY